MASRTEAALLHAARQAPPSTLAAVTRVLQVSKQPLQAAYLARVLNALVRSVIDLDERSLGDAVGATSDYRTLLHVLEQPEVMAALRAEDPLAGARLRGLEAQADLLEAEGGTLGVAEVAKRLNITRQAVDKRRRVGRLLALSTGRRGYAYPVWQFAPAGTLPGFEETLQDLGVSDAWVQAAFFLDGNLRLGGASPLDELRRGNSDAVRRAARAYGEQGAA